MKIKNIIILSLLLLGGCKNFLNVQPQGEVIPTTDEEFAAIIHTRLQNIEGGEDDNVIGNMETISLLEGIADNLDANIKAGNLALYSGTEINKWQTNWKEIFEIIRDCNIVIENIEGRTSETARGSLKAAYSMKAICYYNLLRIFCQPWDEGTKITQDGLPLIDRFDIMDMPVRANMEETFGYIDGLFSQAINVGKVEDLYFFNDNILKIYQAKLYFWCEKWDSCIKVCEDLVNNSGYSLTGISDYEAMIQAEYQAKGEVIVRSHINDASELDWYFTYLEGYIGSRPVGAQLVKLFGTDPTKDVRYNLSFDKKRFNTKTPEARVRLSEAVLMLSEAYYHKNDDVNALKWLNELRKNRIEGVIDYQLNTLPKVTTDNKIIVDALGKSLEPLIQAIFHERQKELYMEGDRWFELKRNGSPQWWIINNAMKYTTVKYLYTAPIFKGDIDINPKIKQNPGYES